MLVLPSRRWRSGCPSLLDGLVLGWPLDEPATGSRRAIQSNPAGVLTDVNTVGTADAPSGIGGLCASFNGSNEYLYCADPFPPPAALSVGAWVYVGGGGNRVVIAQLDASQFCWQLYVDTGAIITTLLSANGTSNTTATGGTMTGSTWTHLAFAWDGSTVTVYKNGVAGTPVAFTSALFDSTARVSIGANRTGTTPQNFFNGRISQPLIWRRALAPSEILYLYAKGSGRPLADWMPRSWI